LPNICSTITGSYTAKALGSGDWDNALRTAGFDPDKMRLQGSAKDHQEAAAHA
jgi:hypothetical protein